MASKGKHTGEISNVEPTKSPASAEVTPTSPEPTAPDFTALSEMVVDEYVDFWTTKDPKLVEILQLLKAAN